MKFSRSRLLQVALILGVVAMSSSCGRGYGCPMSDFIFDAFKAGLSLFF